MKILFISYFFDPYPGVGAKRVSYWADEILNYGIEPTVITAIEQKGNKPYPVHYVPNTKRKRKFSLFIKDEGYSWELDQIDFFEGNDLPNFDYILISGGPFMQMGISSYLKGKFKGARVILDFRDPFGNNPRFLNESFIKKSIKQYFESKFIKLADKSIVVNPYCKELIRNNEKIEVIENGFDERSLSIEESNVIDTDFIYAGKIYDDVSIEPFVNAIIDEKRSFTYFGSNLIKEDFPSELFQINPPINYVEVLKKIASSDVGIVFTGGKAFESTTKVFDYIALNKRILIVTEGEPKTGNLHEITKVYPNVVWAKNNEITIKKAIETLVNMEVKPFDSSIFSRKYSLEQLVELIKTVK